MKNLLLLLLSVCTFSLFAQLENISPPDLNIGAVLGSFIEINGNEMLTSASRSDELFENGGALYYYRLIGGEWQLTQTILPSNPEAQTGTSFGTFFSLSDNWIAASIDQGNTLSTVIFYRKENNVWNRHSVLINTEPGVEFGWNIEIEGNRAIIGAPGLLNNQGLRAGGAFVYEFNESSDQWEEQAVLQPADLGLETLFGESIYLDGDLVAIGTRDNLGNGNFSGAVYVFEKNQNTWAQTQKLFPAQDEFGAKFGYRVDGDQDRMIISGFGSERETGVAYIYKKESEWILESRLEPSNIMEGDWFGSSVAIQGNVVLVGARHNTGEMLNSGSLFVFENVNNEWVQTDKVFLPDGQDGDRFGTGLGYNNGKIVVGAPGRNGFQGAIYELSLEGITTSTNQKAIKTISLYPNPLQDFLHLDLVDHQISKVDIYSIDGIQILSEDYLGAPIDLRQLEAGNYVLRGTSDSDADIVGRFIKL